MKVKQKQNTPYIPSENKVRLNNRTLTGSFFGVFYKNLGYDSYENAVCLPFEAKRYSYIES